MIERYPSAVGTLSRKNHYEMNGADNIFTDDVERFFNRKTFHYEAIIPEQVRALNGYNFMRFAIPLVIDHYSYTGSVNAEHQKTRQKIDLLFSMPDGTYLSEKRYV